MAVDAADLIVAGTKIHTSDPTNPVARAFAVRDGRFICVGSTEQVMKLRGRGTEVLKFDGATVLPGLVDAHLHLTNLGLRLQQVNFDGAQSAQDIAQRCKAFAQASSDLWIRGRGWDENRWQGPLPTHAVLSEALPDRPVALARIDGHALLVNARAMELSGIDHSTPDPPGGRILRDANGKPTGVLIDAAQVLVYRNVPPPTRAQLIGATRAAIAQCHRWGITAVAEPGCDDDVLGAHSDLIERGGYSIRNHAMLDDEASLLEKYFQRSAIEKPYAGRLSIRAVKMYADGALGSRGAALLAPYSDEPNNSGLIVTPPEHIESVVERAVGAGFQPSIHAIGDRANRLVLDVYEAVSKRLPNFRERRPRIEHAQIVAPEDVTRFAELGVIASIQATHALSDLAWARTRLGPSRIGHAYAWRALLDSGARIANGTDAPVESTSTARTFFASTEESDRRRRMTRREALASMTAWAAYANFQEDVIGSVSIGKYADFVVMDRDWMRATPQEIVQTSVLATYFEGKRVY